MCTPQPSFCPYTTLFRSQRALRGRVERFAPGAREDFWTWRTHMFELAGRLEPESMRVRQVRSEEHTSEPSHVRISYAVFCLKKKTKLSNMPHHPCTPFVS